MMYLLQQNALWVLGAAVCGAALTWFMTVRKVDVAVLVTQEELEAEDE